MSSTVTSFFAAASVGASAAVWVEPTVQTSEFWSASRSAASKAAASAQIREQPWDSRVLPSARASAVAWDFGLVLGMAPASAEASAAPLDFVDEEAVGGEEQVEALLHVPAQKGADEGDVELALLA